MTQEDYLEIILTGYVDNPNYLDSHFYRAHKEAERNYIDFREFFDRLKVAYKILLEDIDNQHSKRLIEVSDMIEIYLQNEAAGKINKCSLEELERQTPEKNVFTVNLSRLTNGKYRGYLSIRNLNFINQAIETARQRVLLEKVVNKIGNDEITNTSQIEYTHREIILAHNFKVEAGVADFKTSSEWEKEGGARRKIQFYTLDRNNRAKYIAPTQKETRMAIELLADCEKAKALAEKYLLQLQKL